MNSFYSVKERFVFCRISINKCVSQHYKNHTLYYIVIRRTSFNNCVSQHYKNHTFYIKISIINTIEMHDFINSQHFHQSKIIIYCNQPTF